MWRRACRCMRLYFSLVLTLSRLIVPILPLLCSCFLQFLSTSSRLPSPLIRGTPQRWRIIPDWSSEAFMSWEDTLARGLPDPILLHRFLQSPTIAATLLTISLYSEFSLRFLLSTILRSENMSDSKKNTNTREGGQSISR